MKENQNVEWKIIWKDEYLRWICSFANSSGGVLYVGVSDDGKVIGIKNAEELVYAIPHKVKDFLGIVVETSIKKKKNLEYICIKVAPHPYPVSLRGKYYIRSGSNTYEAVGVELDRLMLKKLGKRWESLSGHKSSIKDLDPYILDYYRELAHKNHTLTKMEIDVSDEILLRNLRLFNGNELTYAALLIFAPDPEEWVYNSFIKICEINKQGQIIREDKVSGPIIIELESAMNILCEKYQVKQKLQVNELVLKEILTNAIIHKSYDSETPIEIKMYENKLTICNPSIFPSDINNSSIYNTHPSMPYNPKIANVFNKCGLASLWGLGTEKIKKECINLDFSLPKYRIGSSGVEVRINPTKEYLKELRQKLTKEEETKYLLIKSFIENEGLIEKDVYQILRKMNHHK